MLPFDFCSPTYFAFGKDTEQRTGELVKRFGGTHVLIHYGGGSVIRSGLMDRVQKSLTDAGITFVTLGGAQPNPRDDLVYEGIELCRKEKVDFVLGVGGGSAIDSAKAIAVGVPYEGDFWDIFYNAMPRDTALPIGTVLTLPATGSEASDSAVITKTDGMLKYGYSSQLNRPVFSILNPELTYTLPPYQTACGIADMMAHILERYLSNSTGVELTDRLCEGALQAIMYQAPIVMADPENYNARANLMWAGMIAHNNSLGVGREQDWSSHQMAHELSSLYDAAHGAALAVVFPAFMKFTLEKHIDVYAQMAVRVFGCDMDFKNPERTAREGIARYEAFLQSIGMPLTLREFGAKEQDIPFLAGKVRFRAGDYLGNFQPLTRDDVAEIYKICF